MNDEPTDRLQQAREIIAGLSEQERATLRYELEQMFGGRTDPESGEAGWDYQRQPYGRGWIQRERKVRPRKDGSKKVYVYWSFHWIEDGKRRSEHIGSDEKLEKWKEANPGWGESWTGG